MSCDHSLVGKDCFCCSSVSKSCLILSDPKDCSMRGSSVLNYLPEFANSGPLSQFKHLTLCHSLVLLLSVFPSIRFFPVSQLFASDGQSIGTSASVSVLPMNTQGWFPLRLTGLISLLSKGLSRVFSSITVGKHQFCAQPSLWFNFHVCPRLLEKR